MSFSINDLFPSSTVGLQNIGFLFGAGTSKEAGFPLTKELTIKVLARLKASEKKTLYKIFKKESISYDLLSGDPDIEYIVDMLQRYRGATGNLEDILRSHMVEELTQIKDPNLDIHVRFFNALKKKLAHTDAVVWIFTTNYDLAFETAAGISGIPIHNGFEGINSRYFDIDRFHLEHGTIDQKKFHTLKEPRIHLVKLHGSVSWFEKDTKIMESFGNDIKSTKRFMVLPGKQKKHETLDAPYDRLFRYAKEVIGRKCKYLVTCGYSFRDQHINEQLLIPGLRNKDLRIVALYSRPNADIIELQKNPDFNYISKEAARLDGHTKKETTDIYKFSGLVNLLET